MPRNRTIRWDGEVDEMAVELAHSHRFERGVSELLERLVRAEGKRKRGIAHLHSDPLPDNETSTKRRKPKGAK